MNYIYVGEVVNTHGIKGELRVISNFNYKDKVFVKGMLVYLGLRKQKMTIASYRKHKNFALITLEGIEDLIDLDVIADGKTIGKVLKIVDTKAHRIIVISGIKNYMVPYVDEYIKNIDLNNKTITINAIKGLLDED